jgi:cell wall-associated NlpC family hydrolase
MFDFNNLTGRPYSEGRNDCFGVLREYYWEAWGVWIPNLARPTRFWEDEHLDLYSRYREFGFEPVFDNRFEVGDAVLMPIRTAMNSHAGAIVADNQMLHHFVGELSTVVSFRPKWERRITVQLRHPDVTAQRASAPTETTHLHEVLNARILQNPGVKSQIARQLEPGG